MFDNVSHVLYIYTQEVNFMTKPMTMYLSTRVTVDTRKKFVDKCESIGDPSTVLREMVEAFIDDRMTIKPNRNQQTLEG